MMPQKYIAWGIPLKGFCNLLFQQSKSFVLNFILSLLKEPISWRFMNIGLLELEHGWLNVLLLSLLITIFP